LFGLKLNPTKNANPNDGGVKPNNVALTMKGCSTHQVIWFDKKNTRFSNQTSGNEQLNHPQNGFNVS
jgi:hypothetical protein